MFSTDITVEIVSTLTLKINMAIATYRKVPKEIEIRCRPEAVHDEFYYKGEEIYGFHYNQGFGEPELVSITTMGGMKINIK